MRTWSLWHEFTGHILIRHLECQDLAAIKWILNAEQEHVCGHNSYSSTPSDTSEFGNTLQKRTMTVCDSSCLSHLCFLGMMQATGPVDDHI